MTITITKSIQERLHGALRRRRPSLARTPSRPKAFSWRWWNLGARGTRRAFKALNFLRSRNATSRRYVVNNVSCPPAPRIRSIHFPLFSDMYLPDDKILSEEGWDLDEHEIEPMNYRNAEPLFEHSALGLYCPPSLFDVPSPSLADIAGSMTSDEEVDLAVAPWHTASTKHTNMEPLFEGSVLGLYCPPSISHLPPELLEEVIEFVLFREFKDVESTYLDIRQVSLRWKAVAERLIQKHMMVDSDFLNRSETRPGVRPGRWKKQWHPTFLSPGFAHDKTDLMRVLQAQSSIDSSIDSLNLTLEDSLDANLRVFTWGSCYPNLFYHSLSFHHFRLFSFPQANPWSRLTFLFIDRPLSLADCYFVVAEFRHTLQSVSFSCIGHPSKSKLHQAIPTFSILDLSVVALPQLAALSIHSHINIQVFLGLLLFPALSKVELHALPEHPLLGSDVEPMDISAGLPLPWDRLIALSLGSESKERQCRVGSILSECDELESFEWKGRFGDFALPTPGLARRYLSKLNTLRVNCDEQEGDALLQMLTSSSCQHLRTISLPSYHSYNTYSSALFPKATSIVIRAPIYLFQLVSLMSARRHTLIIGEFTIAPRIIGNEERLEMPFACARLRHLTLRSGRSLASLWPIIRATSVESLDLIYDQSRFFSKEELPPFLSYSRISLKSSTDTVSDRFPERRQVTLIFQNSLL